MKHPPLVEAIFLRRENRFLVTVELQGEKTQAHLPNSGRLRELLTPGREVLLAPVHHPGRKTAFDLKLVRLGDKLVSVDARLPALLLREAIEGGDLPEFGGYERIKPEPRHGLGRLDLLLQGATGKCFVEAKSVTLVEDGVALFPDAPTLRGRRHLKELISLARGGHRTVVAFIIQRDDALAFAPNAWADPQFAEALTRASQQGVEVRAYVCEVTEEEITLKAPVPVRFYH